MTDLPDFTIWLLATALLGLFGWFFWHTGAVMLEAARHLIGSIQNWPQIRRAMVEAEVRSGGRYPFWFRAARVTLIIALIGLLLLLLWRKLGNFN